jgi:hypothetical protein
VGVSDDSARAASATTSVAGRASRSAIGRDATSVRSSARAGAKGASPRSTRICTGCAAEPRCSTSPAPMGVSSPIGSGTSVVVPARARAEPFLLPRSA